MSDKKTSMRKLIEDFNKKRYKQLSKKQLDILLKDELVKTNRLVIKKCTKKVMLKYFRKSKE